MLSTTRYMYNYVPYSYIHCQLKWCNKYMTVRPHRMQCRQDKWVPTCSITDHQQVLHVPYMYVLLAKTNIPSEVGAYKHLPEAEELAKLIHMSTIQYYSIPLQVEDREMWLWQSIHSVASFPGFITFKLHTEELALCDISICQNTANENHWSVSLLPQPVGMKNVPEGVRQVNVCMDGQSCLSLGATIKLLNDRLQPQ